MVKFIVGILVPFGFMLLSNADSTITSEKECKSKNGAWARYGLSQKYMCNLPTKDAGTPCMDSKFCQSECVIKEEESTNIKTGDVTKGVCYGHTLLIGTCLRRVQDGKATPVLCVD